MVLSGSPLIADDDRRADVMRNTMALALALGPVQVRVHLLTPVTVR